MPDIKHAGGHEEIRRIAGLALTTGVEIAPYNPTGPVCPAHSVHPCATRPNLLPLEARLGETDRFVTLPRGHDLRCGQGSATPPAGAGPGLAPEDAAVRATPWQPMPRPWLDPRLG